MLPPNQMSPLLFPPLVEELYLSNKGWLRPCLFTGPTYHIFVVLCYMYGKDIDRLSPVMSRTPMKQSAFTHHLEEFQL